ncbi:unnamed protein product [Moneuplotes crassus]|uniref:Tyrosine-protein kinase ephrin type A/B receptor-like domain-containing protein n=1 Tax=Euplotes crassus TaxID=5936 RepID=A0AAD1XKA5_EUPCR|nr:unnamed protein product [Moneuplotes crassus]
MILKQDLSLTIRIILVLAILCCASGLTQNGSDIEIFSQTIKEMKPGDMMPFRVSFGLLKENLTQPEFISTHFVIVELYTEVIECNDEVEDCDDPLDLKGIFEKDSSGNIENTTSSLPRTVSDGQAYYYLLFDLCYVDSTSKLQISIMKQSGKHKVNVQVHIDEIKDFNVNCVGRSSDIFEARKYHGACEGFNNRIWTFGGIGDIKNGTNLINSLAYYDDNSNQWVNVEPQSKISPEPRYGMRLFCYFNYLIMFGGQGDNDAFYADLWIFDIIRSYWHKVSDSLTEHDLDDNQQDKAPDSRAFFGGELLRRYGSALIFGGIGEEENTFCDIWSLDIENALLVVEDPIKKENLKIWNKITPSRKDKVQLCRYGHDSLLLDDFNILIFGGATNSKTSSAILYKISQNKFSILRTQQTEIPSNRFFHAMIGSGNGVVLMYGGKENDNILSEYWMLKVDIGQETIKYIAFKPKSSYYSLIFAWREGFSFHHSVRLKHPIIIGGGFGNNQEGNALLSLPTITCADKEKFEEGGCTPCPPNSYYNIKKKECDWCTREQFFYEDKLDYFNSKCKFCPPGTIGSSSGLCTSCLPGSLYDPEVKGSCKVCDMENICPFGTKHEFSKNILSDNLYSIQYANSPQMFKGYISPFDNTAMWVLFMIVISLLSIFPLLFCLTVCKPTRRYAIKIMKEVDLNPITGGEKRLVVGGVISIVYAIILICCSAGIIAKYFLFNERVEATELANIANQNNLPESYSINLTIYSSFIYEDINPLLKRQDSIGPFDLCDPSVFKIGYSSYFNQAFHKNISCTRKRLSSYTDRINIILLLDEISLSDPSDAYILFKFKSEGNRIIHFFEWQFQSIWSSTIEAQIKHHSSVKGMMIPQTVYDDNLNITTAFRGPDPTVFYMQLIPTFYSDEINSRNLEGYRVLHKYYEKGSTINERTYTNMYTTDGRLSENFSIKFETSVSPNVNNVRVTRLKSIIDVATQILGLLAGLAFICRFIKFILMKCNVWVHLDREYNIYYKEDKRKSVALNHPSDRKQIEQKSDFWENSFPYSNKDIPKEDNGETIVTPQAQDGFGAMMRNQTSQMDQKTNKIDDLYTDNRMVKYQVFQDDENQEDFKRE